MEQVANETKTEILKAEAGVVVEHPPSGSLELSRNSKNTSDPPVASVAAKSSLLEKEASEQNQKVTETNKIITNDEDDSLLDEQDVLSDVPLPPRLYAGKPNDEEVDRLLGIDQNQTKKNGNDNSSASDNGDEENLNSSRTGSFSICCNRGRGSHSSICTVCCPHASPTCLASAKPYKVGNSTVLQPKLYNLFSVCIIGPHWHGAIITHLLLYSASYFFTRKAYEEVNIVSAVVCVGFTVVATVSLFFVWCADPGIVRNQRPGGSGGGRRRGYEGVRGEDGEDWRYCDLCSVYQPPDGAHCHDCNACIEGYDHHCPWMGTCIGKKNFTAFMIFNLSWLFYLIYAVVWVSFIGPNLHYFKRDHDNIGDDDGNTTNYFDKGFLGGN